MAPRNYPSTEEYERLEHLIDRVGMNEVLEMLSDIAYEKAEHISSSYNDKSLSDHWNKIGYKAHRLASLISEN